MERELGVTYKTAWRICHLIRTHLMTPDDAPLSGQVEADEMYVGRRRRGQRGRPSKDSHKVPVFGMVQRGGNVIVRTVPNAKGKTIMPHMTERILPASIVYTDEYGAYNKVGAFGYTHRRIHHAEQVYVSGDIHTNTIEGFWSLVKSGIRGVYHLVSAKHLQSYLSEYAWRYNRRNSGEAKFLTLLLRSADAA
jgi:transposase-like protein